jgi:D-tyrosyl-tRNA(Tyr) deacylase
MAPMKVLIQRVSRAEVRVGGERVAGIGLGLLILVGVEAADGPGEADYYAEKTASLRIFDDGEGKMNLSLKDVAGEALVVSQFTLAGSTRKGRRPSFDGAARPESAVVLYELYADRLRREGIHVLTGRFQEMMQVELVNEGPVTFLLDRRGEPAGRAER